MERRKIIFTGHVQGVGFRMTTVMLSRRTQLAGAVRNVDGGGYNTVELIVEGETKEIDQLLARLREHFGSFIRTMDQTQLTPVGALSPGINITH